MVIKMKADEEVIRVLRIAADTILELLDCELVPTQDPEKTFAMICETLDEVTSQ